MYKTIKKLVGVALISSMIACGFAGCSKSGNDNKGDGKTVNLTYWHIFVGADSHTEYMKKLLDQFEKDNPNIKIEEQGIPNDQYKTKLQTQAAAKQLPDMFINWAGALTQQFQQAGLITDITDLLDKNQDWKNGFVKGCYDDYTIDGKVYSLPVELGFTSVVYYNKALFDKYNLQFPKNFDELVSDVAVFKKNNVIPISMGDKAPWLAQSCIMSSLGDHMTGTDWTKSVAANKGAKFTDPEFINGLKKLKQLVDIGAFNEDFNTIDATQQLDNFCAGKAAMVIDGTWAVGDIAKKAGDDMVKNFEVASIPGFTDGKGDQTTMSGATGIGLELNSNLTAEKKAAAEKFIQYILSKSSFETAVNNSIIVPYDVTPDESKLNPLFVKLLKLTKEHTMSPVYDGIFGAQTADAMNTGLQSMMIGQVKPEDLAKQIQDTVGSK
ncbi:extracellular solute-binding protein [Clostridium sp. 19966]|uniref:extracellular solute-binding protein n=1 Tax=Clostridium sp. 19966 TaxID=2768166 RepID=UPI0028E06328|nr:extracellular solute-binding protein [Clostridium sp. 19966]MDT8716723.1 extracellular solute-binding protein [Clostridium sp. 19966]